ncbi:hypothetical protein [Prevotella sp. KH2C16]|uniref:hypothetical protein n=1 Tax=Prevotella sp. KH2C16 TaxID=1855325 RepID=UPI0008F3B6F7|nr:hypothetical protein [Prevotella sp. KH2C16]SFG52818.1 hypothetical protein SAMN05216383_1196 [Prevotella sp. KH2C16]
MKEYKVLKMEKEYIAPKCEICEIEPTSLMAVSDDDWKTTDEEVSGQGAKPDFSDLDSNDPWED